MLILIAEHDLPRLFGVFAVINFSFGTGLYFALVEPRNNGNIDVANENVTRSVIEIISRSIIMSSLLKNFHAVTFMDCG